MKYKINKYKHVYIIEYAQDDGSEGFLSITVKMAPCKDIASYNDWEILRSFKDKVIVSKRLYLSRETIKCLNHFINQAK